MNKVIYARKSLFDEDELKAAKDAGFKIVYYLSDISDGDYVVPRYSMYPFVKDQYSELSFKKVKIINNLHQHFYVANLGNYYNHIKDLTAETIKLGYVSVSDIPFEPPYVLKGETNSRKSDWKGSMYAETREDASRIFSELSKDTLIGQQDIFARKFLKFKKYLTGIGGMPVIKEYRCFVAFGEVISKGFYWANYYDDIDEKPSMDDIPDEFLQKVIDAVGANSNFYCIDVAQGEDEQWYVVELNCGMQAGLSMNDPVLFYQKLHDSIKE
jgi:hypothetical protein